MRSIDHEPRPHAPLPVILVVFAGASAALAGAYLDDAWHTERGRDGFLIAPHIAIYAGIASAGAALTAWGLLATRAYGVAALRHKPLGLALVSVAATLVSGPIDNAWHTAFGRDAVIWSPPHMLGITGILGLGAAVLSELASRRERWARSLSTIAGALVLAASAVATIEYDTDVPQFAEVFYLPVLGLAATIALGLVRLVSDGPWAATAAALTYTAFILAVAGLLKLVGFPPPALPLLVVPALVVDVVGRRRWHPGAASAAIATSLYAAYVPVRDLVGEGVRISAGDVVVGLPLTWLASLLVLVFLTGGRPRMILPRAATLGAMGVGVALFLGQAPDASAHDPGQGTDAGTLGLSVSVVDMRATLTAAVPSRLCPQTEPAEVIARRAGREVRAPLLTDGCRMRGSLRLPDRGRWFVYAEMRRDGHVVESWLPVSAGPRPDRVAESARYAYVPPQASSGVIKLLGGVVLYAIIGGLLYATFTLVRKTPGRSAPPVG